MSGTVYTATELKRQFGANPKGQRRCEHEEICKMVKSRTEF